MSEENKAIVKRWNDEIWDKGNVDIIDELADDSYVGPEGRDREAFKQFAIAFMAAFSDAGITIEDLIAEGEKVAMRWTVHGTHTGEYEGIPPYRQAGRDDGDHHLPCRGRQDRARLGFLQQLGVIPPMG